MTDDEIKAFLKPRTHWGALITTALAVAGAVWGATQYLGDLAKRSEVSAIRDEAIRLRLDMATMSGRTERVELSQQRTEKAIERIEGKLDDPKRRR